MEVTVELMRSTMDKLRDEIESLRTDNARLKRIEAAAREVDFRADNFGREPLSHMNISLSALRAELEKGSGDG